MEMNSHGISATYHHVRITDGFYFIDIVTLDDGIE